MSSEGLRRKIEVIRESVRLNRPDREDPLDVLSKVGGLDIAGLTGVFLGGAVCRIPVMIDGFISSAAALCAVRMAPECADYILASHSPVRQQGEWCWMLWGSPRSLTAGCRWGKEAERSRRCLFWTWGLQFI